MRKDTVIIVISRFMFRFTKLQSQVQFKEYRNVRATDLGAIDRAENTPRKGEKKCLASSRNGGLCNFH